SHAACRSTSRQTQGRAGRSLMAVRHARRYTHVALQTVLSSDRSKRVSEKEIGALLGLHARDVRALLASAPSTAPHGVRRYRWRDISDLLKPERVAAVRATARVRRQHAGGSKYWVSGYSKLVAEWHPTKNGELFPDVVSHGSNRLLWWKCKAGADHEWRAAAYNRTAGQRCPFCTNRKVSVTNNLAVVRPEFASEWH